MTTNLTVLATFSKNSGQPATGLTLAEISLYLTSVNKATGAVTVVWDGTQNPTVEITNIGSYARILTTADLNTYDYVTLARYTGATVLDSSYVSAATGQVEASVMQMAANTLTASALATDAVTEIQSGLAIQASVDDLEGRLTATRAGYLDNLSAGAIATAASVAALNNLSAAQVNAEMIDVLRTDTIPDSYAADGSQPTIAQAILAIHQFLTEKAVVGTTVTVNKPDGTTAVMTFTLDDASAPTSITRAA